jgi:tetratricopeptide (TPR) repeat protein
MTILLALTLTATAAAQTRFEPLTAEATAIVARGDSCQLMNDTHNSLLFYEQARRLVFNDTVLYKLAQTNFRRGQFNQCLALTDTLLADTLTYQPLKLRYNCLQKMSADDSLRIECARQIIGINPLDAAVITDIATYFNGNQQADSAIAYCNLYRTIDSTNQLVNKQLGRALFIKKDYYPALDLFLDAFRNGDQNPALLFYIGRTYECCSIPERAHEYLLMAAEGSYFTSLPVVKALARVSASSVKYRDEVLDYTQIAFDLCQADSASMAEIYRYRAKFYGSYHHDYRKDSAKWAICQKNSIKMLKKSLEYEPSIEAQFEIATTYNSLNDLEQEKLWLEKVAAWPRSKSNAEYIRYAELRLISIREEKFFKGDKLESVVVED